jgi:hypothetical protein
VVNLYKLDTISNGSQDLGTNYIYKTSRPVKGIHAFGIFVIVLMCELFFMWWTGRPVRLEMLDHILHSYVILVIVQMCDFFVSLVSPLDTFCCA